MASLVSEVTFGQVQEFIGRLGRAGMTAEMIRLALGDDEAIDRMVAVIGQKPTDQKPTETYPVTVDYTMPLADMIAAGRYDYANPDITAERFPIMGGGKAEVELMLVHFGRVVTTEEAEREIKAMGLVPEALPALLALGAKHPDLQRQDPIVALGSSWVYSGGRRYVPYLDKDGRGRRLYLGWGDPRDGWSGRCRFLARRA